MNKYSAIAISICNSALERNSITRTDYNTVRRCGALLEGGAVTSWRLLNGAIHNRRVAIIEDGSLVAEMALSFDANDNCNGVFSLDGAA
jgi:hypothetical protein